MNTDGTNRYSVWQGRTWSTECSNRYNPPRNDGYDDDINSNQQPVGLRQDMGMARIVAALQASCWRRDDNPERCHWAKFISARRAVSLQYK